MGERGAPSGSGRPSPGSGDIELPRSPHGVDTEAPEAREGRDGLVKAARLACCPGLGAAPPKRVSTGPLEHELTRKRDLCRGH